jgi:hypothetical protein
VLKVEPFPNEIYNFRKIISFFILFIELIFVVELFNIELLLFIELILFIWLFDSLEKTKFIIFSNLQPLTIFSMFKKSNNFDFPIPLTTPANAKTLSL